MTSAGCFSGERETQSSLKGSSSPQLSNLEEKGSSNYPLIFMTIIWCSVQSRHLSGGRKKQTLSTAKYALLQATVKPLEIKAIPQPVGASQGLVTGSLLHHQNHLLGTLTLLAAEAEDKFAGGYSRSDGHKDHLIKDLMISPRYQMAKQ